VSSDKGRSWGHGNNVKHNKAGWEIGTVVTTHITIIVQTLPLEEAG